MLTVSLKLSDAEFGVDDETFKLYAIEDALIAALSSMATVEGHEIGKGYFSIFVSGQNPGAMLNAMHIPLSSPLVRKGSFVIIASDDCTKDPEIVDLPIGAYRQMT